MVITDLIRANPNFMALGWINPSTELGEPSGTTPAQVNQT